MLEQFSKQCLDVISLAESTLTCPDLAVCRDNSTLQRDLEALRHNRYCLAVVAPFSAGKSTFINALLGTNVLSMALKSETATITRIRRGGIPTITVHYHDIPEADIVPGDKQLLTRKDFEYLTETQNLVQEKGIGDAEEIGSKDEITFYPEIIHMETMKKLLTIISTVQNAPIHGERISRYLPHYVDAPGESNGQKIQEIRVSWDLKLWDEGVEFIDTPGLFARHEDHSQIALRILPQAHAVIFLVEPDKVGEANFVRLIRDYVREAKVANLDTQDKHIFFLINKIDRYPKQAEYNKVVKELRLALEGVLPDPQILRVSSYYALRARQYLNGEIKLEDLQMDSTVRIPNPQDARFPLCGQSLTEEHVPHILESSHIQEVERVLEEYLGTRYERLLNRVKNAVVETHQQALEMLGQEVKVYKNQLAEKQMVIHQNISGIRQQVEELNAKLLLESQRVISSHMMQNSMSYGGNVPEAIKGKIQVLKDGVNPMVIEAVRNHWSTIRSRLCPETAEQYLGDTLEEGRSILTTSVKDALKQVFNTVLIPSITEITAILQVLFEKTNVEINKLLEEKLALDSACTIFNGDFGLESMAIALESEVEAFFVNMMTDVNLSQEIENASLYATNYVSKPGFWNWVKSFAGRDEKEEIFDNKLFQNKLDRIIVELLQPVKADIHKMLDRAWVELLSRVDAIREVMEKEIKTLTEFQHKRLDGYLKRLHKELSASKVEISLAIQKQHVIIRRISANLDKIKNGGNPYINKPGDVA